MLAIHNARQYRCAKKRKGLAYGERRHFGVGPVGVVLRVVRHCNGLVVEELDVVRKVMCSKPARERGKVGDCGRKAQPMSSTTRALYSPSAKILDLILKGKGVALADNSSRASFVDILILC